ncbi:S26 family signal peptidase [Paenibacillus sp. FSL R10-2782]
MGLRRDSVFVLGDNPMNSTDSRFLRYISMNKVIGKVIVLNGIPLDETG